MENETETIAHAEPQHLLTSRIIDLSKVNLINIFLVATTQPCLWSFFTQLDK